jgi:tryptophan halogenase
MYSINSIVVSSVVDFILSIYSPVSSLIKECSATIKSGIKFTNWNGDQTSYFHHFFARNDLDLWSSDRHFRYNLLPTYLISKEESLDRINFMSKISEDFKVPFMLIDVNDHYLRNYQDPMDSLQNLGTFALHFDARLLAKFLRKTAEQRGISRIEGKVKIINNDDNGNVKEIILENNNSIMCDFIFDCSGFARLIIGKHFNVHEYTNFCISGSLVNKEPK